MWTYQDHQIEGAAWALHTIRQYGFAYLGWEERTRKTGAGLLTVENSKAKTCLIITKKKAIPGWEEHFEKHDLHKKYTLINYESVHKIEGDFDFIILDEAHHAISSCPKPSLAWKRVSKLTKGKPILYMSATPYAEHLGLIFHQFKLSSWTPFPHDTFYRFHREYGIPDFQYTPTPRETYKVYQNEVILAKIKHLFDWKTRAEVGIEHEPQVNLIEVELSKTTKEYINEWTKTRLLDIPGHDTLVNDNPGIARSVHYQLEGGTIKDIGFLGQLEKVNYILDNYDTSKIAIMAHFVAERLLLKVQFPEVRILSSDGDAEGVDLSDVEKLIVYSMSDKTSKYTQRLARQANHDRKIPIIVDILVAKKPGIGKMIYEAVALKKENFVKNSYEQALRDM